MVTAAVAHPKLPKPYSCDSHSFSFSINKHNNDLHDYTETHRVAEQRVVTHAMLSEWLPPKVAPLRPFTKREVMPGNLKRSALENSIRDAATSYWHQTCTAKMGRDSMSVVDANLKVYGIENLRVADGSIMPRVTTGNTIWSLALPGASRTPATPDSFTCSSLRLPRDFCGLACQHKIERRYSSPFYFSHLDQQVTPEQRIASVAFLPREIQLGGQHRAAGRLKSDVVVAGSSGIQTRQNGLQRVPSIGIRELVPPAAEAVQIVFAIPISMPEIEKDARQRFPSPIQNKPSHIDRCPIHPRFAKVVF
jgi:hypothetical protein